MITFMLIVGLVVGALAYAIIRPGVKVAIEDHRLSKKIKHNMLMDEIRRETIDEIVRIVPLLVKGTAINQKHDLAKIYNRNA